LRPTTTHTTSTLFPYTPLFRSRQVAHLHAEDHVRPVVEDLELLQVEGARVEAAEGRVGVVAGPVVVAARIRHVEEQRAGHEVEEDRKSTRLNSSHQISSYAVVC